MRIALFGGTFDPVHRGHLAIAGAAADAFALDRVLFAPVARQPLKQQTPGASFSDRLAMVTLAIAPQASPASLALDRRFAVSTLDAPRPDGQPNYTIDTLHRLGEEYPDAPLFVLTGADSFLDLPRWRSPHQLLDLAEWIVVSRPGAPSADALFGSPALASLSLTPVQRERIRLLPTVHEEVSSTELRERLLAGDRCDGLLPPGVIEYIQTHHLYRSPATSG